MSQSGSPDKESNEIRQAHAIAMRANLFIVPVTENGAPAWVIYRKGIPPARNVRIALRSKSRELLRLVKRLARRPSTPTPTPRGGQL